jgi:hypothetical protein
MPAAAPQATSRRSCGADSRPRRPSQEASHRRQLHHRALPPDRAAGSDREQRRRALHHRRADRQLAAADQDGLHVIRGALAPVQALAEEQHEAGHQPAGRRDRQPLPPRQLAERVHHALRRAGQEIMDEADAPAEQERRQRPEDARPGRPEQRLLPRRGPQLLDDPQAPAQQAQQTLVDLRHHLLHAVNLPAPARGRRRLRFRGRQRRRQRRSERRARDALLDRAGGDHAVNENRTLLADTMDPVHRLRLEPPDSTRGRGGRRSPRHAA